MLNYNIRILGVKDGNHEYFFNIDSEFFESFIDSEVTNSEIKVCATLFKDGNKLKLSLKFSGEIHNFFCDLCANQIVVSIENSISVLLQESELELEDTDEIVYIQPNQHELDISQLIYEGIIFSIPSKREHSGKEEDICDKEMIALLNKYTEKEEKNDPRWDELNKLKDLI
tara:strand:- start:115 stop:627 length:513 start_codon:yes stop_codon:yes gene_type:complete